MHVGIPQSFTRRGHRGTQDHLDSTWAEIHQPKGIDVAFARESQNHCLMHHTRKMSSVRERRSYLETMLAKCCNF